MFNRSKTKKIKKLFESASEQRQKSIRVVERASEKSNDAAKRLNDALDALTPQNEMLKILKGG